MERRTPLADSVRQALRYLRDTGLLSFGQALGRRLVDIVVWAGPVRHEARSLEEWVSRLAGTGRRPGSLVWAMQKPEELIPFLGVVRELQPRVVVEIGTAAGGVLFALTLVSAPDALLLSIDLPGGRFGGGYARWREGLYRRFARGSQRVITLRGDSHSRQIQEEVLHILGDRKIDLLFVDGDHSYEGVRADFESYSPLTAPHGLVAFHDIVPFSPDPSNEVPRFWEELRRTGRTTELASGPSGSGYGIGILGPVQPERETE